MVPLRVNLMKTECVVLAAGQGMRMRSRLPKVLHELGGKAMLEHVLSTVDALDPARVHVVVGVGHERVRERFASRDVNWVMQAEQKGTGHAVAQVLPALASDSVVVVLCGDVPMVQRTTLDSLVDAASAGGLALVTAEVLDPGGLGRIVRNGAGQVLEIVEERDARPEQLDIREINGGILSLGAERLERWVSGLTSNNAQGQYYLTDLVKFAVRDGVDIHTVAPSFEEEIWGVNSRQELARLERVYQRRLATTLMNEGVTLRDPQRLDIRGTVSAGEDVEIDVNVVLQGTVKLGSGVSIGPNCVIRDSEIGEETQVLAGSVIDGARISRCCRIGPFARLRPGTVLGPEVQVGNFVEAKNAVLGARTKANHLAYIGDAQLGSDCNVGAGAITCNYDGFEKHRTTIGNGVFVGSNATLVAPVELGDRAFVAAGSTTTKAVPSDSLTVGRGRQRNIKGWKRPQQRGGEEESG